VKTVRKKQGSTMLAVVVSGPSSAIYKQFTTGKIAASIKLNSKNDIASVF
jgi:hypothetical protein